MDYSLVILAVVAIIILAVYLARAGKRAGPERPVRDKYKKPEYHYRKKDYIMTRREADFFKRLERVFGQKFYIFPQVHLDAVLDYRVKGQGWKGALSKIQRKSLDYAVYSREDMTLKFAIELDDPTHDRSSRIDRDQLVDRLFKEAGIKLIRFRNIDKLSDQEIVDFISSQL